jgi:hypothetical protein
MPYPDADDLDYPIPDPDPDVHRRLAEDGHAPASRGGTKPPQSFTAKSAAVPRSPPPPPRPWPPAPRNPKSTAPPPRLAKDESESETMIVHLFTDPDTGDRRLTAYLDAGVVELEPNAADLDRAPGWYDSDWRRIPSPVTGEGNPALALDADDARAAEFGRSVYDFIIKARELERRLA